MTDWQVTNAGPHQWAVDGINKCLVIQFLPSKYDCPKALFALSIATYLVLPPSWLSTIIQTFNIIKKTQYIIHFLPRFHSWEQNVSKVARLQGVEREVQCGPDGLRTESWCHWKIPLAVSHASNVFKCEIPVIKLLNMRNLWIVC